MGIEKDQTKEKKVKVSFFLNKNVKPSALMVEGFNKGSLYPLYIAVTFNRKNMQFKCKHKTWYPDEKKIPADLKANEERLVTQIIRYEYAMSKEKEEFDMKGLSAKYDVYTNSINALLEVYLKQRLHHEIHSSNCELLKVLNLDLTISVIKVFDLFTAAAKLYESFYNEMNQSLKADFEIYERILPVLRSVRFDYPTVIDWLDGTFKEDLRMRFANGKNDNEDFIQKAKKLIDDAIAKAKYDEEGRKAQEAFVISKLMKAKKL